MIIAIDGPAASGKGTLAKLVARHWGLPCLDTGLLYRAVARDVALDFMNVLAHDSLPVFGARAADAFPDGDPRAGGPLTGALTDESERVRLRAAEALGLIGDRRAVGPLSRLRPDDPDESNAPRYERALSRIAGIP